MWWCELAWLGDPTGVVHQGVVISLDGERIGTVGVDLPRPPRGSEPLRGLTIPGPANAHSHAFHRALRGRTHGADSFWTWRDAMYDLAARLDPDTYRALATATFAEMALAGFTCVGEFHYLHHAADGGPYANPNEMGEVIREAAEAAGIRLTLLDTCYLHGGIGTPPGEVQRRFDDGQASAWIDRVGRLAWTGGARVGAAIHSVRAVDPDSIGAVAAWAEAEGQILHAHVSEQPDENQQCLDAYGCTPTELLDRRGALGDRFTAVHVTHATTDDLARLQATGSTCCLCPTTERDLADGVGPTATLRRDRTPMCLGTDSHAVIDPFEEARAIELDERLVSGRRGTHQPGELLAMATAQGYRSLGWPDGGRLEAGALADFTTISLDSPRLAGLSTDHLAAGAVFGATADDVHHVVVGGRVVVRDGTHRLVDVPRALDRALGAAWA